MTTFPPPTVNRKLPETSRKNESSPAGRDGTPLAKRKKFWGFTNPSVCLRLRIEMIGSWFMNALLFGFIGMWETVAILAVILVLFGAKKVPELARGLGQGIKEFKKATKEVNDDLQRAFDDDEPPPPPRKLSSKPQETVPHSSNEPKG
jgi:sec-independent protein translocase protein TatA